MVELIPKVAVSQLAPIVLYSRIIRFQSRSLAIIYSEFSVLALYAVLLFIATCCSLPLTPRQIAPIPFYFALFLSFVVFHFARCFAFLLRSFLLCFGITSLYFSLLTRPALFRFVAFSRLFSLRIFDIASFTASLSLSLPFSLFPLVLRFINSNAFRPFLGFVRALFRPILLYPASFFRRFSLLSLCLPPRIAGLLLIFFARFFNFVSLCFALRAFNPFYIVF